MSSTPRFVGVDGSPDGWVAVEYSEARYIGATLYSDFVELWAEYDNDDTTILVDVPIGLRETTNDKRPCDDAARKVLGNPRSRSVFPPPIRAAAHATEYEAAKEIQEENTDGSLGTQAFAICEKIAEVDDFLRENKSLAGTSIREAHPEVCFWALAGDAMSYSKTGQPAAAFWERVNVLQRIDSELLTHAQDAANEIIDTVSTTPTFKNDDLLDAFALALTASNLTGGLRKLPDDAPETVSRAVFEELPDEQADPEGLPMEMVYANPN
ncbi:DUF429 domain-containing protein [Haloarchaeobius sp. DFWS5]|uniref:DUF429 domain-containing protein n=1 Tax=Haloarchaeobius sp. DFWS5 TaxID=3446114 RepID=UPI003EBC91AC